MRTPDAQSVALPSPSHSVFDGQELVDRSTLSEAAKIIKRASARTPHTGEGLPIGFYRADLVSPPEQSSAGLSREKRQVQEVQNLQAAYVELSYDNGYPTLPTNEPFWHKLDYEPGLSFATFQMYLEATEEGARELTILADNAELQSVWAQARQTPTPDRRQILAELQESSILYYWRARSRAYDLFQEAAYRHKRIRRAMSAEDAHYRLAAAILEGIKPNLESPDFFKNLKPRDLLDALKAAVNIQRVSVGLPAGGPLPQKEAQGATQFEAILRTLGANANNSAGVQRKPVSQEAFRRIMSDPAAVHQMQEMIIRVTNITASGDADELSGKPRGRTYDAIPSVDDDGLSDDVEFHKNL